MLGKLLPKSDSACENQSYRGRVKKSSREVLSWLILVPVVSAKVSVASVLYIDLALSWHLPLPLLGCGFAGFCSSSYPTWGLPVVCSQMSVVCGPRRQVPHIPGMCLCSQVTPLLSLGYS